MKTKIPPIWNFAEFCLDVPKYLHVDYNSTGQKGVKRSSSFKWNAKNIKPKSIEPVKSKNIRYQNKITTEMKIAATMMTMMNKNLFENGMEVKFTHDRAHRTQT